MPTLRPDGAPTLDDEKAARDPAVCSSCKAPIYWVTMVSGSKMPIDRGREQRVSFVDGEWKVIGAYKSHFASCPFAKQHRKS